MGCLVYVPTALLMFLVAGGFIFRNPSDPVKVSFMIIGRAELSPDSRSDIDRILRMIINHNEGGVVGESYLYVMHKIYFLGQRTYTS